MREQAGRIAFISIESHAIKGLSVTGNSCPETMALLSVKANTLEDVVCKENKTTNPATQEIIDNSSSSCKTTQEIRCILKGVFVSCADFDAFCIDNYPEIYRRFGANMERGRKETLLIELCGDLGKLLERLRVPTP